MSESFPLLFRPVTAETRADFEALFEGPGGPKYCWCMAYRATAEDGQGENSTARRKQMLGRIDRNVPVSLLGYLEEAPVAWVSVAPKSTFLRLGGPEPAAGEDVWSLTCMFLVRRIRKQGLGHQLIAAATDHARQHGASILEAYPVDPDSPSYRFMGFVGAFERAGFSHHGTAGTRRHVMRLAL